MIYTELIPQSYWKIWHGSAAENAIFSVETTRLNKDQKDLKIGETSAEMRVESLIGNGDEAYCTLILSKSTESQDILKLKIKDGKMYALVRKFFQQLGPFFTLFRDPLF